MENQNEKAVSVLNDLIEYAKDGQEGYKTAAQDIKNPQLQSMFRNFEQQRSKFVTELKEQVQTLGGNPEKTGTIVGTVHRGWIDLKSAISSGDEKAILDECERGDSAAESKYDEALRATLPSNVREVVRHQHDAVRDARNQIRDLKSKMK
jgi:uncharacterized protein (TIGR02284 family)